MALELNTGFNPCSLDENEVIPAKIWELLRRNEAFKEAACRLTRMDFRAKQSLKRIQAMQADGVQQDQNTPEARRLLVECRRRSEMIFRATRMLGNISKQHPFASIALQWLVPDPLFLCSVAVRPLGKRWRTEPAFVMRYSRTGVGTTPNVNDKNWVWRNPQRMHVGGHAFVRGPEVRWTKSRFTRLRDKVNPFLEWRRYAWPFTTEHTWCDAPAGFRRKFQFVWRNGFDCRPANPITKDRSDSPSPHEIFFFHDWDLMDFRGSGQVTRDDLYQSIRFKEQADNYRTFSIPKTILTKASADAMGKWLADELKKGSKLYGKLLKGKLLNDAELLGTTNEWQSWLSYRAGKLKGTHKSTYFYRSLGYLNSLVDSIYPEFQISKLLKPPRHRVPGKKYVRK